MYVSIHIYISLLGKLRGPTSNYTLVTMNTPITQILVSNTILQFKNTTTGLFGEMFDCRTGTGYKEKETIVFCKCHKLRKRSKTKTKPTLVGIRQRDTGVNERDPNGQSWNS